ncbi:hypothetical protein BDP27DRAFT_1408044 [Rhodocollybia butyracea]|uniref:Uncharacterized protein n=1 Tax=Rhodocollybia butyracea TaxID=206335 RepID=A0A9P5P8C5_9AGAR|nr:hypothetical protein BDP27DRAFT_1408044 [Rhodocollybia butyracea]
MLSVRDFLLVPIAKCMGHTPSPSRKVRQRAVKAVLKMVGLEQGICPRLKGRTLVDKVGMAGEIIERAVIDAGSLMAGRYHPAAGAITGIIHGNTRNVGKVLDPGEGAWHVGPILPGLHLMIGVMSSAVLNFGTVPVSSTVDFGVHINVLSKERAGTEHSE